MHDEVLVIETNLRIFDDFQRGLVQTEPYHAEASTEVRDVGDSRASPMNGPFPTVLKFLTVGGCPRALEAG
jgi:hypothetical protein